MAIDVAALQTAQTILNQLYAAAQNNPGVLSISVDGQDVTYNSPQQFNEAILFWERRVALLSKRRNRISTIRMDRF